MSKLELRQQIAASRSAPIAVLREDRAAKNGGLREGVRRLGQGQMVHAALRGGRSRCNNQTGGGGS